MKPTIPASVLDQDIPLPFDPEVKVHAKEPDTLGVHRMLGYADQAEGRVVRIFATADASRYSVELRDGGTFRRPQLPLPQVLAAASFLQGHVLSSALKRIKNHGNGGGIESAIVRGILGDASRKLLNVMNRDTEPVPWSGVGIVPCSPDWQEFAFARKDHLHPTPGYCNRLALIGGGMDLNEVLGGWGDEADTAYVAMLRECFEEIRIVDVAAEVAVAVQRYVGPQHVRCFLSREDGQATDGVLRLFLARAPSCKIWDRWRKVFGGESDGLGEAHPELVTLAQLREAIKQDAEAARMRTSLLRSILPADIAAVERSATERFSRKRVADKNLWRANRDGAQAAGEFPLKHRGDFTFIAGVASAMRAVLSAEGVL